MIFKSNQQQGFTIVELMIATAVFSTILLLATIGVLNIGRLYYKGITTSRTQETARSVADEVARSIQLTKKKIKTKVAGQYTAKCIGTDRYTYSVDRKVEDGIRGLWLDEITEGDPCEVSDFSSGRELLYSNMRLLSFDLDEEAADRTKVSVRVGVAYGDSDLLTHCAIDDSDNPGPCSEGDPATAQCRPTNTGGSFCAVSTLETFVKRRFLIVYLN